MLMINGRLCDMADLAVGETKNLHRCGACYCQHDSEGNPHFFLKVEVDKSVLKAIGNYEFRSGQVVRMEFSGDAAHVPLVEVVTS